MSIRNVVFDIGNVLVHWAPIEVIQTVFPQYDPNSFLEKMRPIWLDLNLGKISEAEAIELYHNLFDLSKDHLTQFMTLIKLHQIPLEGSIQLLERLRNLKINLFSITDNVKEIMEYHKHNSEFYKYFKNITVSADIGILKPDPRIYLNLLNKNNLKAEESLFIDDLPENVEGAIKIGMQAFQFRDYISCTKKVLELLKHNNVT